MNRNGDGKGGGTRYDDEYLPMLLEPSGDGRGFPLDGGLRTGDGYGNGSGGGVSTIYFDEQAY